MSLFDDITMGLGLREKDDAYRERTAQNLERQGNDRGAAQVRSQMTGSSGSSSSGSSAIGSSSTSSTSDKPNWNDKLNQLVAERDQIRNLGGNTSALARIQADINAEYSRLNPPQQTSAPAPATPNFMQRIFGGGSENQGGLGSLARFTPMGLVGGALKFGAGVSSEDKVVNTIDGKPVYARQSPTSNGFTYYSYNALGLPYDVKPGEDGGIPTSLEEDPRQVQRRERMMSGMGSDDDGPAAMPDVGEGTGEDFVDPCPEGYMYDEEQKMCVPDVSFVPDLPEVDPTPLLPTEVGGNYTQMPGGGNYTQMPGGVPALPPLQPYPQAQGLGATNLGPRSEGILQVVAGPQAPRGPAPIPSLTMPQMPPQRRA